MPLRVLLTSWNAYSAVHPDSGRAVGGIETTAWAFAKELAKNAEFDVHFGVRVPAMPASTIQDQVHLVPVVLPLVALRNSLDREIRVQPRFPWLVVKHWSPGLLWKLPVLIAGRLLRGRLDWAKQTSEVVRQVQPDILMSFGVNDDSAAAMQTARQEQIPGLLWLQSNIDVDQKVFLPAEQTDVYGVSSSRARSCFDNSSRVICQSELQENAVKAHLDQPVDLVPQPVDLEKFHPPEQSVSREYVLWIGRYDQFHKRPLLALEVARQCPHIPFLFVINKGFAEVEEQVHRLCPANAKIVEYLPHDRIPDTFQKARLFLSTGSREFEGFPTVFLEAAATGTPVCSLEDFNRYLERSQSGACAQGDVDRLAKSVQELWSQDDRREACSRRGLTFVRDHHSVKAVAEQVASILKKMIAHHQSEISE